MFSLGRYLIISAATQGSALPMNLQGLWSIGLSPPWSCDFHLNVNLQMNYWAVFSANLNEAFQGLKVFVSELKEKGELAARAYYNVTRGK